MVNLVNTVSFFPMMTWCVAGGPRSVLSVSVLMYTMSLQGDTAAPASAGHAKYVTIICEPRYKNSLGQTEYI